MSWTTSWEAVSDRQELGCRAREKPELVSFAALPVSGQTGEVGAAILAIGGIPLISLLRQDKQQHIGISGAGK